MRAEFDNADGSLLPGLYARIRLGGTEPRQAVLIDEKDASFDVDEQTFLKYINPPATARPAACRWN